MASPEYMVLVNDIVMSVKHYMKGIPVTKETLALDIIDKVGPGGNYIMEKHTMDHFKEVRYSDLFDRKVFEKWEKAGDKKNGTASARADPATHGTSPGTSCR